MRSTLAVRKLMTSLGALHCFTNKYAHCRTVKCNTAWLDVDAFMDALPLTMFANDTSGYSVKRHKRSIIVRLPLDF